MKKLILILIIILSAVLRLWQVDTIPAINADEAALGYNAYSLIQTGRDEHGNVFPVHFQSFNDYKPGLYVYLIMPFIKIFGLNALAVRLPAVLFSIATVYLVYLLVKELFNKEDFALISAFFLAITPWHVHFSRGGWEVTVATFFVTIAVYLFIKAIKHPTLFLGSFIFLILSLYTYQSTRIISPLLFFALTIIYWKDIKKHLNKFLLFGILSGILLLPLFYDLSTGEVLSRASGVGILADRGPVSRVEEQRGDHKELDSPFTLILHNKFINYGLAIAENWADHFWGEFLFISGDDIQRNKVPETGVMYLHDIVFVLVGIYFLSKNIEKKEWQVISSWLIIGPSAAALTFQSPHALRAENMVIPLTIISAYGFYKLIEIVRTNISRKITLATIYILLTTIVLWGFARYQLMYWGHMTQEYPYSSQYGVKELVEFVGTKQSQFDKVVVTDRYDQPYILFLYYLKYTPQQFQSEHNLTSPDEFGFSTVRTFGKYVFHSIHFEEDKVNYPNALIIGTDEEIPDEANIIKNIYGPNGYLYFQVVAN